MIAHWDNLVMAAPTGSGKTLAGFLAIIDRLLRRGLEGELKDQVYCVYVSPLKALVRDIHANLLDPLAEIKHRTRDSLGIDLEIKAAMRTGDTPSSERAATLRKPPHILVTTPESLYLLLTSTKGRALLAPCETVIVDEIHALAPNKRGAHLLLSLARLERLAHKPIQRIAISATQRPLSRIASFIGANKTVDCGHYRNLSLSIELPDSPLSAVMSLEVWDEIYRKLADHINQHTTTIVFVNTRRLAERVTHQLSRILGEDAVAAHHGSLSFARRQAAEESLRSGGLKALVATASMELGIDVGDVDLVCQIGSPKRVNALLQRVGRSGHHLGGTPKGIMFPLTRDELLECVAARHLALDEQLEVLELPQAPIDVLAQQIVAEVASAHGSATDLYQCFSSTHLYRNLDRATFDQVLEMLSSGFATPRGRRAAWIHWDKRDDQLRARRGARLTALTSGGAIPDNADYKVVMEPKGIQIGTLNEDFAIESLPGDIFALGSSSWRILRIGQGEVRVEDASGLPPTIPFWFGEAPSRSRILSQAVSSVMNRVAEPFEHVATDLAETYDLSQACAQQLADYLIASRQALGTLPNQKQVVIERFFDTSGGMQLVIHAPFGAAINRAWGLALRKRFCRSFNFELQAAAIEDAIVISLSQVHAFPLEDVIHFLHPHSARQVLEQALLDAPIFQTRWRWTASLSLAIPRRSGGKEVPPFIRRMQAEDLITAVFPDQLACLENIQGDREIPDHPLIQQTLHDCLHETMDVNGFVHMLEEIYAGTIAVHTIDLPEPSLLASEIINAKPYAFLDDAPLEERRTRAVQQPQFMTQTSATIHADALQQLRQRIWPVMDSIDDAYDGLYLMGCLEGTERQERCIDDDGYLQALVDQGRAVKMHRDGKDFLVAWERVDAFRLASEGSQEDQRTLILALLQTRGPLSESFIADWLRWPMNDVTARLMELEASGQVFRGHFDPTLDHATWSERWVLDQLHRLSREIRRASISPISSADYMRFLLEWQFLDLETRMAGADALAPVLHRLVGASVAAAAWESNLLPQRIRGYQKQWLDTLGSAGRIAWMRALPSDEVQRALGHTPICLVPREEVGLWSQVDSQTPPGETGAVLEALRTRDWFVDEIVAQLGLPETRVEQALSGLAAQGLVRSDLFAGLRSLIRNENERRKHTKHRRLSWFPVGTHAGGRWAAVPERVVEDNDSRSLRFARLLLDRYGIVFRRIAEMESLAPSWRDLVRAFWRLEAQGDILSGHLVSGFSGQHFALRSAWSQAKQAARKSHQSLVVINACDPVNLTGVIAGSSRVPARWGTNILYRNGEAYLSSSKGRWTALNPQAQNPPAEMLQALKGRNT
ncbi:MAG: DEAD/DEAH box helicase [Acidobacteria bacterium]|nr:DEAD/DEAH box helicase [Acidobacteriota bacterium]